MKIFNNPLIRVVAAFLFVALLSLSIHTVRSNVSSAPDFPTANLGANSLVVVVEIPAGASGSVVGQILYENKVTKSALAYFRAAVADPRSGKVAPGAHELNVGISARQALVQLLDPARIPNLIKVFEGGWKSEVIDSLLKYGFTERDIDTAFKKVVLPGGFLNAEGLLFPAQYSFPAGTSALEAVQSMVDRFSDEETGKKLLAAKGKFSPAQLLTIASLIQAEGGAGDFYKVSRVIRNRLEISMPLQLDATVHYVKKLRGEIFLSTNSTLIKSPYNTYRNYGLPPTPIGNPGSDAIAAALKPADGDWLYFITVAPGDTRFTRSHDEFLTWKALFVKNRKAGVFK
ncbi:MAG: endolytic transglycosylase MltG [Actinobacteria bacterium]|nr:endolytic transglycosylase MltG [Actinomycetota bacterium]